MILVKRIPILNGVHKKAYSNNSNLVLKKLFFKRRIL